MAQGLEVFSLIFPNDRVSLFKEKMLFPLKMNKSQKAIWKNEICTLKASASAVILQELLGTRLASFPMGAQSLLMVCTAPTLSRCLSVMT